MKTVLLVAACAFCTTVGVAGAEPSAAEIERRLDGELFTTSFSVRLSLTAAVPPVAVPTVQRLPEYPIAMRRAGVIGVVSVRVTVDEHGKVISSEILSSNQPEFADATKQAVKGWVYLPALKAARPCKSILQYQLHFDLFPD